ncbi:MAG TPA: hypothetical protein VLH77_01350, partial [Gammaproteobacteria bacterium]|nr:hypothetical protein [Gammaproteobacteria bacterium]
SARMSVAVTEIDILLRSIRLAGAITLLAPYWIEGSRNELCMALSGFLYRTAKISEAIADPSDIGFQMTEQLAESFLDTLIEVCNDD